MIRCLTILVLVLVHFNRAQAQLEFTVPYPDTTVDYYALTHKLDDSGNLYVMTLASEYFGGPGVVIEGMPTLGSTICKTNPTGQLHWHKMFQTFRDYSFFDGEPNSIPTRDFFLTRGGNIMLPTGRYTIYNNSHIKKNALIVASQASGNVVEDYKYFDSCCSDYDVLSSNMTGDSVVFFYCENDKREKLYYQRLGLDRQSKTVGIVDSPWWEGATNIKYDPYSRVYVDYRSYHRDFAIFDESFQLVKAIKFLDTARYSIFVHSIAFNRNYWAISYAATFNQDSGASFLTIIDKAGHIILDEALPGMQAMWMSKDNTIWGAEYRDYRKWGSPKPVNVFQYELTGRLNRSFSIGMPYVEASGISIFGNRELVVTGTRVLSYHTLYPNKQPSEIYVYRQIIDEIPEVPKINKCEQFSVFPNPSSGAVFVVGGANSSGAPLDLRLTNTIGQVLQRQEIDAGALQLNMDTYATGVYFITVQEQGDNKTCNLKMVKN